MTGPGKRSTREIMGVSIYGVSKWGSWLWGSKPNIPWDQILDGPIRPGSLDAKQTALNRLWKQFEVAPNWRLVMTVIGELGDELDDRWKSINFSRYVNTASGVQLDMIGELVRRDRSGLSDTEYRLAIIAETVSLFSSGTVPEILEVVEALLGPSVGSVFIEQFPAAWKICIPNLSPGFFDLLLEILADQPAAGVAATLCTFDPLKVGARRSGSGSGGGLLGSRTSSSGPGTSFPPLSLHHHGAAI